ncbi:MAG TPA: AtpZ/AtpI family protein [Bryobacteraceae bacterium]|nr:AtpZ/AtpI family protein [Bryobacteraceae bacterium]
MLPNLKNEGPLGNFGRYLSLAALLPISTFIGYAIGYGLDHFFGTHFLRTPSHIKTAFVVKETGARFVAILAAKQGQ